MTEGTISADELEKNWGLVMSVSPEIQVRPQGNAVKSGFVPAWAEMTIKPESVVREMNGETE